MILKGKKTLVVKRNTILYSPCGVYFITIITKTRHEEFKNGS